MIKWFHFNYGKAGVCIVYLVSATLSAIPKRIEVEKKQKLFAYAEIIS